MVVDVEILRTLQAEFTPLTVDEESLAFVRSVFAAPSRRQFDAAFSTNG